MITDEDELRPISEKIIGAAFRVHSKLGGGFLEKCYENALVHDLRKAGLHVDQQVSLKVWYDGIVVGDFIADLIVEHSILIELKAIERFDRIHSAICINYLTATGLPLCPLINFGKRSEVKRIAGVSMTHRQS